MTFAFPISYMCNEQPGEESTVEILETSDSSFLDDQGVKQEILEIRPHRLPAPDSAPICKRWTGKRQDSRAHEAPGRAKTVQ